MKYGCIGEHLKHSFSKEIHNCLSNYEYELKEIPKDEFEGFIKRHDFVGINVTIPYKETVIPYLYYIDDSAKEIGAVNTVVNRNGKLYGYNTDFYGMCMLIAYAGVNLKNRKVAILGTGGTSKTARAVSKSLFAKEILTVSRTKKDGTVTYDELYEYHKDLDVIINTTPVGMFPNNFGKPIDITKFPQLSGVIDVVYNPLKTQLISDSKKLGIMAEGGLYMLVAQAVLASEIFLNKKFEAKKLNKVFEKLKKQKENIVLIGMPSSGKSTVGKELAKRLDRKFYDTDELIAQKMGITPFEIITSKGEEYFRRLECEVVKDLSKETGVVISTGGGVVLSKENVSALSQNGRIYFLDRPLDLLMPTDDRPLTSTRESLVRKYNERLPIYNESANVIVDASGDVLTVANSIIGDFQS